MLLPTSYNGWPAAPTGADIHVQTFTVLDVTFPAGVRGGDVATVFQHLVLQLHRRVERIHPDWCWGFNYRADRNNPDALSCHASATAIDYNAPAHPNGVKGTFSVKQRAEIQKILAELEGAVAAGEFFQHTTDGMHFEISATPAEVHRVAVKIRAGLKKPAPVKGLIKRLLTKSAKAHAHDGVVTVAHVRMGLTNPDVLEVQRVLNRWYPNLGLTEDGAYGKATYRALDHARLTMHVTKGRHAMGLANPKIRRKVLKGLGFKCV